MIPEIGHLALIIALIFAFLQAGSGLLSSDRAKRTWLTGVTPAFAFGQTFFLLFSYLALTYLFVNNDFSVAYVANHSNTQLPIYYRISAVWGAHEGSLLLWVLILSLWSTCVAWQLPKQLSKSVATQVLGVLGSISTGFLLFILWTSNPFLRLLPFSPEQGRDLNPLLQDPGLIMHPPMLYMGYVGFAVAFALAIVALWRGELERAWAQAARTWTLVAWLFLTLGITLGSWWAYYELGWGGWWFWDPVENASLLPWLVGTALLHSLLTVSSQGIFKRWVSLLAIAAFSLSLLGTFLVRSGVLTSVHAFANDPERGVFILILLGVVVGGSLLLYATRAHCLTSPECSLGLSRETLILTNNSLLVIACATVLLGTIYPLILDAMSQVKLSVGAPYFNRLFVPLAWLLMLILAVGPVSRWRQSFHVAVKPLLWSAMGVSVLIFLINVFVLQLFWQVALTIALGIWVVLGSTIAVWLRTQFHWQAMKHLSLRYYGMLLAHLGVVVTAVGVAVVRVYSIERDVRMQVDDSLALAGYVVTFKDVTPYQGANYKSTRGQFTLQLKDKPVSAYLFPEKRVYLAQGMPLAETAIDANLWRDIYIALGEPLDNTGETWAVRVYYKPLVRWLWLGGLLMVAGAILSVFSKKKKEQHENPLV